MFEDLPPILPLHLFALNLKIKYLPLRKKEKMGKEFLLPSLSPFLDEPNFSEVHMGWNEKGIHLQILIEQGQKRAEDEKTKDEISLFFDTRDAKTGFLTKFCHQFLIVINKAEIKEITRFRNDESHPLADPDNFNLNIMHAKKASFVDLFIPQTCLYGFDVERFNKIGFSYRIEREEAVQDFTLSSKEFSVDRFPSFWATLNLVK